LRPARPEILNVRRSRILAIDDEPALCAVIRRLLAPQHELVTFVDAREALRLLKTDGAFDVIFCDVMMPKMSGIDFYDELSELDPELASRTVFLTGGAFSGPGRQFLASVPNRVIEKPFDARSLEQAVANVLEGNPRSGTWPMSERRSATG
jgi:CheY-like chemotaxis protein